MKKKLTSKLDSCILRSFRELIIELMGRQRIHTIEVQNEDFPILYSLTYRHVFSLTYLS